MPRLNPKPESQATPEVLMRALSPGLGVDFKSPEKYGPYAKHYWTLKVIPNRCLVESIYACYLALLV